MFLELVKRLSKVDDGLLLGLNLSKDGVYTISVSIQEIALDLYSFSSTSIEECYSKVSRYIDCLTDNEKFDELIEEITTFDLEV